LTARTVSKADLHIHSLYSDGADDIPTILEHVATRTDIRVIAITDHDTVQGAHEAQRLAPRYGLDVIIGQEVTSNRGHVLALFIKDQIPAGLSIPETVERIHAQGGIAILAHPFDRICNSPMRHWPRPTAEEWQSFSVDALEGINGCQVDPLANSRSAALGKHLGIGLTGGSDAHHRQVIGVAHTVFPGRTAADLRHALIAKTTRAAGRRWNLIEYLGWTFRSYVPRTLAALVPWLRPRLPQTLAALDLG